MSYQPFASGYISAKELRDQNAAMDYYFPKYLLKYKGVPSEEQPSFTKYLKMKEAKELKKMNVADIDSRVITAAEAHKTRTTTKAFASRLAGKAPKDFTDKYLKKLNSNIKKGKDRTKKRTAVATAPAYDVNNNNAVPPKAKKVREAPVRGKAKVAKALGIKNYDVLTKYQLETLLHPHKRPRNPSLRKELKPNPLAHPLSKSNRKAVRKRHTGIKRNAAVYTVKGTNTKKK